MPWAFNHAMSIDQAWCTFQFDLALLSASSVHKHCSHSSVLHCNYNNLITVYTDIIDYSDQGLPDWAEAAQREGRTWWAGSSSRDSVTGHVIAWLIDRTKDYDPAWTNYGSACCSVPAYPAIGNLTEQYLISCMFFTGRRTRNFDLTRA